MDGSPSFWVSRRADAKGVDAGPIHLPRLEQVERLESQTVFKFPDLAERMAAGKPELLGWRSHGVVLVRATKGGQEGRPV